MHFFCEEYLKLDILYLLTLLTLYLLFLQRTPEDGHNAWPKHVGDYADYSVINLHICMYNCWLFLII